MAGDTFHVNVRLLPVKFSYFFVLGAVASLLPYLAVYMRYIGLSPSETAIIYGVMPFLGAFVRPVFGMIADKLQKHKVVLMACCLLTGIFHCCLLWVPLKDASPAKLQASVICDRNQSFIQYCTNCEGPSTLLENTSTVITDPFQNRTLCNLVCTLKLNSNDTQPGICFVSLVDPQAEQCSESLLFKETTNQQVDFFMDEMNHTLSQYIMNPYTRQSSTCHHYSMTAFYFNDTIYQLFCEEPVKLDCLVQCSETVQNSKCLNSSEETSQKFGRTFWYFFVVNAFAMIAFSPIFSLIDAMTYDYLGEERGKWGKSRLWGTVGYAIFGLAAGLVMDMFTKKETEEVNFLYSFVMFTIVMFICSISVCFYKISNDIKSSQMMSNVCNLLKKVEILSFLLLVLLFGMLTGVIETFLYWHLKNMGAPSLVLGLCIMSQCVLEIPILFTAGFFLKRLGMVPCLYIAGLAYSVRFGCYYLLDNYWFVLGVEPLHGITFGLMYAAATAYGSAITPPGMHGTIQGLIGGLHFGFGKGIGSVTGGIIFEAYGAKMLFLCCAITPAIAVALYFMLHCVLKRRTPEGQTQNDVEVPHDPKEVEAMMSNEPVKSPSNDEQNGVTMNQNL